jgi:thiol-disulfide isomerase/thioredoxin/tetratricopeptide (TPR) repeat protein
LGKESEVTRSTQAALARLLELSESSQQAHERLAAAEARIALDASDGTAWLQQAIAHGGLSQWELAAGDFQKATVRTNFATPQMAADFAAACLDLAGKGWDTSQPQVAGQSELAVRTSREGLRLFRQLEAERPEAGIYSSDVTRALWHLANALASAGRREEARQAFTETIEAFARAMAQQPGAAAPRQDLGDAHIRMANLLDEMGKPAEAERHFESAAAIFGALKAESPNNAWFWHEEGYAIWRRGGMWADLGDKDAAEVLFRQAATLHEMAVTNFPGRLDFVSRLNAIRRSLASLRVSGDGMTEAAPMEQMPPENGPAAFDRAVESALAQGDYSQALRLVSDELRTEQTQLGPTNAQTLQTVRRLADLSGCVADWAGSVRQMRVLMALPGCDLVVLRGCAVAALLDGDERTYREVCTRILSEYGATKDPGEADKAAKTCLLIPGAAADLNLVLRLADVAANDQTNSYSEWFRMVKGMAEYRAGNAHEALSWLDGLATNDDPRIASLAGFFAAMAQQRRGNDADARTTLALASDRFDAFLRKGDLGAQAGPKWWFDAAAAILIRAEAERLILGREVSPRPTTDSLAAARRAWWLGHRDLGSEYPASLVVPAGWKASFAPDNQRIAIGKIGGGIAVVDLATQQITDLVPKGQDPAWSPDGKFIAYVTVGGEAYLSEEVWMVPTAGGGPVKIGDGGFPAWTADSSRVVFHSRKLNQILSAGVGAFDESPSVFFEKPLSWYPAVSPDGSRIAFGVPNKLVVVDRATGETLASLATPGERGLLPCWSPDGRQVAFGGIVGSRAGLWIYDVERRGAFQVARNSGCTMPAWSPDGKQLAFDLRGATNEVWLINTDVLPRDPVLTQELPSRVAPAAAVRESLRSALVGRPVPGNFRLPLLEGGELVLPDTSHTNILLLDFWATWCGPCRQVMPTLADISREYAPRGVRYVAVNLREKPETIRSYLSKAGLDITVALDTDGAVAQVFQVEGIPTMVVVDRENIVRKVHVGASPEAGTELRRALNEVLGNDAGQYSHPPEGKQPGSSR